MAYAPQRRGFVERTIEAREIGSAPALRGHCVHVRLVLNNDYHLGQSSREDSVQFDNQKTEMISSAEVERTRRLYRHVVTLYDGFRSVWSRWTRPAEDALDELFRKRIASTTRVLELAPGTGINIDRLFSRAPDFASYLGIDSSEEMLERARKKARGDTRIELRLGDATDLRDVDGSFDFIVCTWLLSHLDAPVEAVRDAVSKLSPGGTAAFIFFTAPKGAIRRFVLERLGGPFRYRFVDTVGFSDIQGLERLESHTGGMATLAVCRGSEAAGQ